MSVGTKFFHYRGQAAESEAEPVEAGDAVSFARERLGFEPDERQQMLLGANSARVILNCTRQWGKSTVTAARTLWEAATKAGALVLIVSPSWRQSGEFIVKVRGFADRAGISYRGDGVNRLAMVLGNGSRVVALPSSEARIRGFSAASLVVIDEAARVDDSLYRGIRPALATTNGAVWMLSTPLGKRGFFWKTWECGGERWQRISVPATECPRIAKEFLEEERDVQGDWKFRQEYLCEFADGEEALFERETLMAAIRKDILPLNFDRKWA